MLRRKAGKSAWKKVNKEAIKRFSRMQRVANCPGCRTWLIIDVNVNVNHQTPTL
jgi:hypothetical protein